MRAMSWGGQCHRMNCRENRCKSCVRTCGGGSYVARGCGIIRGFRAALPLHAAGHLREERRHLSSHSVRVPATASRVRALVPQRIFLHVRSLSSVFLHRSRHRPWHRQHPDLSSAARASCSTSPRWSPSATKAAPTARKSIQAVGHEAKAHAGQGARQHQGHPPDEGRRDRRLHRHRADAQAVHQEGAPAARCSRPARASSSACPAAPPRWSAAPSENRRWAPARASVVPDRRADGRRDWRRPAGGRSHRLDGRWTSAAAPPKWA